MSSTTTTTTYGRGYAWLLVTVFTALSVVLNGAHAVLNMPGRSGIEQTLAALVAIVAPVSLLLATELVVKLIRDWSRRRRWLTALRGVCASTTAAVGLVAFATSFVALMDMARRMGVADGLAWALPAVVDAMIIIATLAVVVAEAEMRLDREGVGDDVVLSAAREPGTGVLHVAHDLVSPSVHAADDAAQARVHTPVHPEPVPVQPVTQHDDLDRAEPAVHGQEDAAAHDVHDPDLREHDDEAVHTGSVHTLDDDPAERADEPVHANPAPAVHTADDAVHDKAAGRARPLFTIVTDDVHGDVSRDDEGGVHALAERVHAELNPSVDVDALAELIRARRDDAASYRELGEMACVSPNTVRKWIKAADEILGEEVTA